MKGTPLVKWVLPLLTGLALTSFGSDILITEYVEGSSNNKALEITNFSDASINLALEGYELRLFLMVVI